LAVLHPPTAAHARIMEKAGCEALFVVDLLALSHVIAIAIVTWHSRCHVKHRQLRVTKRPLSQSVREIS
jgi:hypothetical protein